MLHRPPSRPSQAAEIRAGELLTQMKARGERQKPGDNQHKGSSTRLLPPKLSDIGVSKTQSSRWQKRQRARWSRNAKACRARKKAGVICVSIRINERMIDTLVRLGHVREFEDRPPIIARAVELLIASVRVE